MILESTKVANLIAITRKSIQKFRVYIFHKLSSQEQGQTDFCRQQSHFKDSELS